MKDTKFTQGKWFVEKGHSYFLQHSNGEFHIMRDANTVIAMMGTEWDDGNAEANAHLIAAAPDMYEALEKIYNYTQALEDDHPIIMPQINAIIDKALSKARGEL